MFKFPKNALNILVMVIVLAAVVFGNFFLLMGKSAAQEGNSEPKLVNVQVPNGNSEIIEVSYDSTLEVVGDQKDLHKSYNISTDTINNISIEAARVGDPKTSIILLLNEPILPQDGDLHNSLTYNPSYSENGLQSKNSGKTVPGYSNPVTVENNLDGPEITRATIPSDSAKTLSVRFSQPIQSSGNSGDLVDSFSIQSDTINDVTITEVLNASENNSSKVQLRLSEHVYPKDDDLRKGLAFQQTKSDDLLHDRKNKIGVENDNQTVVNLLDGPSISKAYISKGSPQLLTVKFSTPIRFVDDSAMIADVFSINADTNNHITIEEQNGGFSDGDATIKLKLSDRVLPGDGDMDGALSLTQSGHPSLVSDNTGVPVEDSNGKTIKNHLTPGSESSESNIADSGNSDEVVNEPNTGRNDDTDDPRSPEETSSDDQSSTNKTIIENPPEKESSDGDSKPNSKTEKGSSNQYTSEIFQNVKTYPTITFNENKYKAIMFSPLGLTIFEGNNKENGSDGASEKSYVLAFQINETVAVDSRSKATRNFQILLDRSYVSDYDNLSVYKPAQSAKVPTEIRMVDEKDGIIYMSARPDSLAGNYVITESQNQTSIDPSFYGSQSAAENRGNSSEAVNKSNGVSKNTPLHTILLYVFIALIVGTISVGVLVHHRNNLSKNNRSKL